VLQRFAPAKSWLKSRHIPGNVTQATLQFGVTRIFADHTLFAGFRICQSLEIIARAERKAKGKTCPIDLIENRLPWLL
jgi:hypothetical protein